ncbi:MAG: hypothetical protein AAB425_09270, partial [Bdellovibrionota bacterium]
HGRYRDAVELLNRLVLSKDFHEFLTIPAYEYFDQTHLKGAEDEQSRSIRKTGGRAETPVGN